MRERTRELSAQRWKLGCLVPIVIGGLWIASLLRNDNEPQSVVTYPPNTGLTPSPDEFKNSLAQTPAELPASVWNNCYKYANLDPREFPLYPYFIWAEKQGLIPPGTLFSSPSSMIGQASFVDPSVYDGSETAYGEIWHSRDLITASWEYRPGTLIRVTNLKNGKQVDVQVKTTGPDRSVHKNRVLDLSLTAFSAIADPNQGVIEVKVKYLCE